MEIFCLAGHDSNYYRVYISWVSVQFLKKRGEIVNLRLYKLTRMKRERERARFLFFVLIRHIATVIYFKSPIHKDRFAHVSIYMRIRKIANVCNVTHV